MRSAAGQRGSCESAAPPFSPEGGEYRHKGYKARTLIGLDGPIRIERARFQCSKTGRIHTPLDRQLDLPNGDVTAGLARRVLHLATHISFTELQTSLPLYFNVKLCDSVLDRLMQRVGGVAVQDEQQAAEQLAALPAGVAREQHVQKRRVAPTPRRLYISSDGVFYPSREREKLSNGKHRAVHHEMKCGAVFWQEADGRWCKRSLSGRDGVSTFGLRLWRLAVECGLLEADEAIFISDGGSWCETVWATYFRDAIRILDWYHLSEHVWKAARALYADQTACARWAHGALDVLDESSGIGLMRFLKRSRQQRQDDATALAALDELSGYLEPRVAYTDYVEYRAKGYAIGSGMMESTCKQVVAQRLKGSGRQWSDPGAVAMTHLIVHRLNNDWNAFWASRPAHRAA